MNDTNHLKLAFVGDIGLVGRFGSLSSIPEGFFSEFKKRTADCDFVIGNLEVVLCDKSLTEYQPKSASLRAGREAVKVIAAAGINVVNLANNHAFDFGDEGLKSSKAALDAEGIPYFGTSRSPLVISKNGVTVEFHGSCNLSSNPSMEWRARGVVNITTSDALPRAQQEAVSIFSHHTGEEHVDLPDLEDVVFFREVISKSHDLYIGHHSHCIQGHESVNGVHAFHSLGNFIFDNVEREGRNPVLMSEKGYIGLIVFVEIEDGIITKVSTSVITNTAELLNISAPLPPGKQGHDIPADLSGYRELRHSLVSEVGQVKRQSRNILWFINRLRPYFAYHYCLGKMRRFQYWLLYQRGLLGHEDLHPHNK